MRPPASVRKLAAELAHRRDEAIVRRFHRLYYENGGRTWQNTRFLGVGVAKCPLDLWIYHEILAEVRPDIVIETGTFVGGSALFMASCMDTLGYGRVITIDIEEHPERPSHPRITYLVGSSTDSAITDRIRQHAEGAARVMVVLDSDHHRDHVLAELRTYSPLVSPGSYLVVEDTNINGHPVLMHSGAGPHEAVEIFLADGAPFERDRSREKFFLTFNQGGWLRRLGDARTTP